MATTISDMTKQEFEEMISDIIENKLVELLNDPDEGLNIQEALKSRLLRQRQATIQGKRGQLFEDVIKDLNLK